MFPLGTVLFPTMLLPLHVFEPRYRALVDDCVAGDGEFGVTLIERGSEVGGGDVRTDVGTVARIVQVERFEDGRFAVAAVGTRRIRIERWLADDPYPRAEVVDWEDVGTTETA
ncbi:MAG: LON peptidase substrate-binding domain-containing protein, partial [Acidimicrobiales bacterium]